MAQTLLKPFDRLIGVELEEGTGFEGLDREHPFGIRTAVNAPPSGSERAGLDAPRVEQPSSGAVLRLAGESDALEGAVERSADRVVVAGLVAV